MILAAETAKGMIYKTVAKSILFNQTLNHILTHILSFFLAAVFLSSQCGKVAQKHWGVSLWVAGALEHLVDICRNVFQPDQQCSEASRDAEDTCAERHIP